MKIYCHLGDGHYIGSSVIVWAGSKKTASKLIRKELDCHGLVDEKLNVEVLLKTPTKKPQVLYVDSGDY